MNEMPARLPFLIAFVLLIMAVTGITYLGAMLEVPTAGALGVIAFSFVLTILGLGISTVRSDTKSEDKDEPS